jgi:serine phosphatase RsbU (regulator of sigma subunit)
MPKTRTSIFILLNISLFFLFPGILFSNSSLIDSLKKELLFCQDSVRKADLLFDIARELSRSKLSQNQATIYMDEFFSLSTKIGYTEGLVKYFDMTGHNLRNSGQYSLALQNHIKALHLAEENNLTKLLPRIYNNIGVVYRRVDDFSNGLNYHLKALKIAEENNDTETIGFAMNSIGNAYSLMKQYDKALSFFHQSLKHAETTKNKRSKAINLNNIGEVYEFMGDFDQALEYYIKSLDYNLEINNIKGLGISYDCLGNVYRKTNRFEKALDYYKRGAAMHLKHKEILFYSISLKNIGAIYLKLGDLDEAQKNLDEGLALALSISSKMNIHELYDLKAQLEEQKGRYKQALHFERLHAQYADSVWNEQNSLNMAKLQAIYDTDKHLEAIAKLNIENQLNEKIIERKNIINITLTVFIVLVLVFSFILYRGYKNKIRNNAQLRYQAKLITRKNNALEKQKKKIEIINTRITDSLNYAQRIQQALLPSQESIRLLFPESFVIYMPLDVVSGDFYWVSATDNKILFATADCTGHGVPGAMMSMLGISYLNEFAQRKDMQGAADYLNKLRDLIIKSLKQKGNYREIKDGISLSLCIYDKINNTLQFSGAQSTIVAVDYIAEDKKYIINQYKGDTMPIGYYQRIEPFNNHIIPTQKLHTLYLFSDGFMDQFGGNKGRRFKKQSFISLIQSHIHKPLVEQKEIFEQEFLEWKSDREQIDDVLVMAVRLPLD